MRMFHPKTSKKKVDKLIVDAKMEDLKKIKEGTHRWEQTLKGRKLVRIVHEE